jgi:hypothetical protein
MEIKGNWHNDNRILLEQNFEWIKIHDDELFLGKNNISFQFYIHFIISLTLPTTSLSRITLIPYG